jgi:hypothetical protein
MLVTDVTQFKTLHFHYCGIPLECAGKERFVFLLIDLSQNV